ncbi:MAG TPA: hypothetical protein VHE99_12495 [Gammaproteobacteria bacterium]|nr:hypothetical protein [Gammaproteobacteria bacterium]
MSGLNNLLDENTLAILQNTINHIILKAQSYKKLANLNRLLPKENLPHSKPGSLKISEDHINALQYRAAADFLIDHARKLQDIQKILINPCSISAHTEALETLKRLNHQLFATSLPALPETTSQLTSGFFKTSDLTKAHKISPKKLENSKEIDAYCSNRLPS